jgi:hypothetical protein
VDDDALGPEDEEDGEEGGERTTWRQAEAQLAVWEDGHARASAQRPAAPLPAPRAPLVFVMTTRT